MQRKVHLIGGKNVNTIEELESYLEENAYSFSQLSIGKHFAPEGVVIEKRNGNFNFSHSERGRKSVIKSFETECELVQYTLSVLKKNEWSKAHIVAYTFELKEIQNAEKELCDLNIYFKRNDIPNYKRGKTAYRIFVFGTDILKLDYFKIKYLHY